MSRNTPRSVVIVAEIREQILAGALAPGERVPSTREIARQWGVAMATATKVITTLRQEGLVRTVPGVGTVVAEASHAAPVRRGAALAPVLTSRPAAARRQVSRNPSPTTEQIVTAAMAIADNEGLAGLSMRRVAAEMGVATMSLYRHVANKDDLLLRMMDAALRERRLPAETSEEWRDRLELVARMLWETFRRHVWLAPALSLTRPQPIAGGLAYTEWVLAALDGCGLSPADMLTTHMTLVNYVRGTAVNLEPEVEAEAESGLSAEQWMDNQDKSVQTGQIPTFERLDVVSFDLDLDELFEFGLQRLLDGISMLINTKP